uniref:Uncharacterized protein n=1 Tax=Anguilla anguilla TaxID=7936 RepID=A0A0E9PAT4_ANGAN
MYPYVTKITSSTAEIYITLHSFSVRSYLTAYSVREHKHSYPFTVLPAGSWSGLQGSLSLSQHVLGNRQEYTLR